MRTAVTKNSSDGQRSVLENLLQGAVDSKSTDPRTFRQVKILNGLLLIAMGMSLALGTAAASLLPPQFSYMYAIAFLIWMGLFIWLRHSLRITFVGRLSVSVLFGVFFVSAALIGVQDSTVSAWFMLTPLAAAVCVGRGDLWFWGIASTILPVLMYLTPEQQFFEPLPLDADFISQFSVFTLASGAIIVSVMTGVWISHHEKLAQRLDDSVERLGKEADAHRLLFDTAMVASGETELCGGARKLLEHLQQLDWVLACCFWDARGDGSVGKPGKPGKPDCVVPADAEFSPSPSLTRVIQTAQASVQENAESKRDGVYYPIYDGQDVVGVIEIEANPSHDSILEDNWLLRQIALQLGHIAERERTAQAISREARHDSLTSLHNRRAFQSILESEIAAAERDHKRVALLFIDLNNFKRVNDSLGHAAGDEVLQVVAQRLTQAVRRPGSHPQRASDSIARVGGDEFTLVLEDIKSVKDAEHAADRILDSLASPIRINNRQFKVGASIGIAIFPDDAQQTDVLVRSADAAMYAAKRLGRSGHCRYRDSDRVQDSLSYEAEMRQALDEGQLQMHYQPVFSCLSGKPVGAEALIRWHHPERGWISPGEFIPLAEQVGLIGEIGKFQFETVLRWFASISSDLPDDFRIALNLSPMQLEDQDFSRWLLKRLAKSNVPMSNIELEITETALLADTPEVQDNVRALAEMGICITLDDFGTGQSSLSLLKRFPIGRIKIDRSFVSGLPDRSEDIAIVGAVLSLAEALEIPVVGEGVEEEAQKQFLIDRHCEDMQGFLLARPMPADAVIEMLKDSAFATSAAERTYEQFTGLDAGIG